MPSGLAYISGDTVRFFFPGREISLKIAYGATSAFITTLCARIADIEAAGKMWDVHGPAERITSVAGMVCVSFVDLEVYVMDLTPEE